MAEKCCSVTFSVEVETEEEPRRTMEVCFLCRRRLAVSSDVFMYRGDTPFCSEDCRQEHIDGARDWELRRRRNVHHRRRRASLLAAVAG